MKDDYKLINSLFPNGTPKTTAAGGASEDAPAPTTKRTFKIINEHWPDFVDLAAARKMTQAELINELIQTAVQENAEQIASYRGYFKK